MSTPKPHVTFWTDAPDNAPDEIKGNTCYFQPEKLEWSVSPTSVWVVAHGPATRVERRSGGLGWGVDRNWGDEVPLWVPIPSDLIAAARALLALLDGEAKG